MKRMFKQLVAALLATAAVIVPAYAYDLGVVTPGDYVDIDYTEFFDNKGNMVDVGVDFSDKNFAIAKKVIRRGPSLVKSIEINNRADTVRITFRGKDGEAPNSPNVIIEELGFRAIRDVKDGPFTILKRGTLYNYSGALEFRVGTNAVQWQMNQGGENIYLTPGSSQYVRWVPGDGYGNVTVEYGTLATLTGRVYEDDKVLYGYTDTLDQDIQDRNPNAYLQALNIKGTRFPNSPTLLIMADEDQYVYENDNGTLRPSGLKWNKDEYGWTGKLTTGKSFIISDSKLRSVAAGSGSGSGSSIREDEYYAGQSSGTSITNEYYNPNTGAGGSGTAVAISAVVAILAIAIVSVIMSTIVSVKNGKR